MMEPPPVGASDAMADGSVRLGCPYVEGCRALAGARRSMTRQCAAAACGAQINIKLIILYLSYNWLRSPGGRQTTQQSNARAAQCTGQHGRVELVGWGSIHPEGARELAKVQNGVCALEHVPSPSKHDKPDSGAFANDDGREAASWRAKGSRFCVRKLGHQLEQRGFAFLRSVAANNTTTIS